MNTPRMSPASIDFVDLRVDRGLFQVLSSSSTAYYVDTRHGTLHDGDSGARMMRARGSSPTAWGSADDQWLPLLSVLSIPIIETPDGREEIDPSRPEMDAALRVGCRHHMYYDLNALYDGWWMGRTVEQIIRLTRMPPASRRTKPETGGRR